MYCSLSLVTAQLCAYVLLYKFYGAACRETMLPLFIEYSNKSKHYKFNHYDIFFHRSLRVPTGLYWRRSVHQALQPQGVVERMNSIVTK